MADTPDTPKPPAKPPAATRRRSPRASTGAKPAKTPPAKPKPVAETAAAPSSGTSSSGAPSPKRAPAPKPRSTKRAPAPKRHAPGPPVSDTPPEPAKAGNQWAKAAMVGSLAAAGAIATAALLSLRGSTPKPADADPVPTDGAHTPDGTDASGSFAAGIADENSIPDKI